MPGLLRYYLVKDKNIWNTGDYDLPLLLRKLLFKTSQRTSPAVNNV